MIRTVQIFPPSYAEILRAQAGQKYRPSNGAEGEIFFDAWCCQCQRDKSMREGAPLEECDDNELCDIIADRAYDIGGDYAEDCADVSPDAKAELNSLLEGWIKKHCNLNFWEVVNVRQYEITAEDLNLPEPRELKGEPTNG